MHILKATLISPSLSRPPSPLMDPMREKYTNQDKLVEDFSSSLQAPDLADVVFYVGEFACSWGLASRKCAFKEMFIYKKGTLCGWVAR